MERYPSWVLSECAKTLQEHVILAIKRVCSSTLIKELLSPHTHNHIHAISHDTPLLCLQMSYPPVTLITGHTLTVTITECLSFTCKKSVCKMLTNTGLFTSPSGISELDCATTKTHTAERSISIGRESLQVFFVLGALAYFQVPPLGGSREEIWRSQ